MRVIEMLDVRFIKDESILNPRRVKRIILLQQRDDETKLAGVLETKAGYSFLKSGHMGLIGSNGGRNAILSLQNWIRDNQLEVPIEIIYVESVECDGKEFEIIESDFDTSDLIRRLNEVLEGA